MSRRQVEQPVILHLLMSDIGASTAHIRLPTIIVYFALWRSTNPPGKTKTSNQPIRLTTSIKPINIMLCSAEGSHESGMFILTLQ